ncbi:helix-turn-helix transcriptional regulator [Demequina sp. TTPB684]|uniref:winged helix-turn-helix transcriptional regulator n=1 Tax=unclassified Demequina TaxID=2620311 RepID=UPI001CF41376|nr:helix-turn-helix domain-containing protein [Demequina sp. TMPB413]MCB2412086.1 helix-turn-helix transcriptional regulator [Demequina sp. TTPB684]UPU88625.1 helix-turn-helix transcriptional regulator [Demequina sp. TMPB413]
MNSAQEPTGAPTDALVANVFARACTSRSALEDVTGKWSSLALLALGEGSHRFGELRRQVDGVSEKMLSQTLRALERDGMVNRTVVSAMPPRVDYELTDLGRQIASALRGMADVLEGAVPQITAARERYDAEG